MGKVSVRDYDKAYYYRLTVGEPKFNVNGPVRTFAKRKAALFRGLIWKKTILDVGCGRGEQARWWSENGASRVVAIDWSRDAVDIARALCKGRKNVTVLKADARTYLPKNRFDAVFMIDFIEHLTESDAHKVYKLCAKKWLVPKGWLGVVSPPRNQCKYHLYHQSRQTIENDLTNSGFVVKYLKERKDGRGKFFVAKGRLR